MFTVCVFGFDLFSSDYVHRFLDPTTIATILIQYISLYGNTSKRVG